MDILNIMTLIITATILCTLVTSNNISLDLWFLKWLTMCSITFWGVTLCNLMEVHWHFREHTVSIFMVQGQHSSEMSWNFYQTTWYHIPKDNTLKNVFNYPLFLSHRLTWSSAILKCNLQNKHGIMNKTISKYGNNET